MRCRGRVWRRDQDAGAPVKAHPSSTAEAATRTRGVATIAAELAGLCVERIGTPESGDPASPEIAALVGELSTAYKDGPKNVSTSHFMTVAIDNMKNGCGPEQAASLRDAMLAAGIDPDAAAPAQEAAPTSHCMGKQQSGCRAAIRLRRGPVSRPGSVALS
jgi:hypothetical protein